MTERRLFLEQKRPGNIALLVALLIFIAALFAVGYSRTAGLIERAEQRGKGAAMQSTVEKDASIVTPTPAQ